MTHVLTEEFFYGKLTKDTSTQTYYRFFDL